MDSLRRKLGIESAETRPFLLMLLLAFLTGGGNVFIDAASNALFVAEYGADKLPLVYIVAAFGLITVGYGYGRLEKRIAVGRLMSGTMLFICAFTAAIKLGLDLTQDRNFIFAALVWYRVVFIFSDLVFWVVAGIVFSLQQGKRLFGLISTGSVLARILGYLLIPVLVTFIGSANLIYLSAALMAAAWAIVWKIMRGIEEQEQADVPSHQPKTAKKEAVYERPTYYIYLMYAVYGVGSICFYLVGFNFYAQSGIQFTSADALASFFGIFSGTINIIALVANTFFTGPAIRRFGLLPNMIVRPLLIFALVIGLLVLSITQPTQMFAIFAIAAITRFVDLALYYANYRPGFVLILQPLARPIRTSVQSVIESIVGSFSLAIAGLMLIVVGPEQLILNTVLLAIAMAIWIAIMFAIRREYPQVLRQALHKRLLSEGELDLKEAAAIGVIRAKLDSEHPSEVVYALALLERVGEPDLGAAIGAALQHESPLVRQEGARRAGRLELQQLTTQLQQIAHHDSDKKTRAEAVTALGVLGGQSVQSDLTGYLDGDDATLQAAAIAGLLQSKGELSQRQAISALQRMATGSSADKIRAANIIRDTQSPQVTNLLPFFLNDTDEAVQIAAIAASDVTAAPHLQALLLPKLTQPALAHEAAQALARGGDAVLPMLRAQYSGVRNSAEKVHLIRAAGRIATPQAQQWLTQFISDPNTTVQSEALNGLYRSRYEATDVIAPLVFDQISAESKHATHVLAARQALSDEPAFDLLRSALDGLVAEIRKKIFLLLSFTHERHLVQRVQENLLLNATDKRAYAVELLDMALDATIKPHVLPLIESTQTESQLDGLAKQHTVPKKSQDAWLTTIISAESAGGRAFSPWAQASAIHCVAQLKRKSLLPIIKEARDSAEPLVAQTAEHVLHTNFNLPTSRMLFMMPTIEKVIILRSVSLFASIPESTLVRVADLLEETTIAAGETLFEKGDYGDNMYIIVNGKVRVHIGDETLNHLSDRDVFGEMALLDPEPRVASVTTVEPTLLLQLNQEPLFELMEDQPAVARAIISVLSNHLRARVSDLREARKKIAEIETPTAA